MLDHADSILVSTSLGGLEGNAASDDPPAVLTQAATDGAGASKAMKPQLSEVLFPVAADRVTPVELAAVFLLGSVAAFFRLGDVAARGNIWAEDGIIFLQTALRHPWTATVFEPYAGYMHLVPRTLSTLVTYLPLKDQGAALDLSAALVQASVATLAYVGTSGFIRQRLWRAIVALCVVAVPVGPDAIEAIANLHWFLIFGGCLCLVWTPRKPLGWGVLFGVLLITTLSSPFAVVLLGGALVRLLVQRSRATAVLAGVVATGFAIQTTVMVMAPPRTGINTFGVDLAPARFIAGFVRRVLGDAVFGVGRHTISQPAPGLQAGVVVVILVAVLVFCLSTSDGFPVLARAGLFGTLAILTYSVPVVATPALTTEDPFSGGRYYLAPALLTIVAIMCLIQGVSDLRRRRSVRFGWLAVAVCGALAVSLLWGVESSWTVGKVWGRQDGPSWQASIDQGRRACAASSANVDATVPISPQGWTMSIPCGLLRG